jgi:hypothetical protein
MADWLHDLPIVWLAVAVFAATYLVAAAIYAVVIALAAGEQGRALKGLSPGMLPPMGLIFGLLVGFLAAQVWNDADRAQLAVNREASALRSTVLLATSFPGQPEARLRTLVRRHISAAATEEWPAMAEHRATLAVIPIPLAEALQLALGLMPTGNGQSTAQRELVTSLEGALDARRQRIIVSESRVNWVKWTAIVLLAILTLISIALVHSENRLTTAVAMWIFASAVGVCVVVIASQDRPFSGQLGVGPEVLLQVMPEGR